MVDRSVAQDDRAALKGSRFYLNHSSLSPYTPVATFFLARVSKGTVMGSQPQLDGDNHVTCRIFRSV